MSCHSECFIALVQRRIRPSSNAGHAIFTSLRKPDITPRGYWYKIVNSGSLENSSIVAAGMYLDRFLQIKGDILTEYTAHRLIAASISLAVKYCEDRYCDYFLHLGVSPRELRELEMSFMQIINYNLSLKGFEKYEEFMRTALVPTCA